jgi:hypothetical protein
VPGEVSSWTTCWGTEASDSELATLRADTCSRKVATSIPDSAIALVVLIATVVTGGLKFTVVAIVRV